MLALGWHSAYLIQPLICINRWNIFTQIILQSICYLSPAPPMSNESVSQAPMSNDSQVLLMIEVIVQVCHGHSWTWNYKPIKYKHCNGSSLVIWTSEFSECSPGRSFLVQSTNFGWYWVVWKFVYRRNVIKYITLALY